MAFEIIMPKLGVDMQEGEIIEWKKQEGDVVNEGDILLEIMSDKTNMELEAEDSGVLLKIIRHAGETVPVTEVIGYIGAEGEVVVRPIMALCLTIDHRIVDGMNGAKFMVDLKHLIENPMELLI